MSVDRVEWICPGCQKRYAIPSHVREPSLCPACRNRPATVSESRPAEMVDVEQPQAESFEFQIDAEPPAVPKIPEFSESPLPVIPPIHPGWRKKYPALRIIALCYRILAAFVAIVAIIGMFLSIKSAFLADVSVERTYNILTGLGIFGGGCFATISLIAFSELIQVQLDIEENTRKAVSGDREAE